ncbi:hypothetical protein V6N12_043123 [Hibiscus sabdariffa]|uniref:Transposase n=1 Tax=Hibiscus sabdariffa TaxID=183260 RepID=A0ABR2DJG6_9ROSI
MSEKEWTSLKDLLPPLAPAGMNSPTLDRFSCQSQMKTHFVKQGCFSWLHQLLWRNIKQAFWKSTDQGFR